MTLFSGTAFFSPSVSKSLIATWLTHGGTLLHHSDDVRNADYVFCEGLHDPWLATVSPNFTGTIAMHAHWIWASAQENFLMPISRFVLDDYFRPLNENNSTQTAGVNGIIANAASPAGHPPILASQQNKPSKTRTRFVFPGEMTINRGVHGENQGYASTALFSQNPAVNIRGHARSPINSHKHLLDGVSEADTGPHFKKARFMEVATHADSDTSPVGTRGTSGILESQSLSDISPVTSCSRSLSSFARFSETSLSSAGSVNNRTTAASEPKHIDFGTLIRAGSVKSVPMLAPWDVRFCKESLVRFDGKGVTEAVDPRTAFLEAYMHAHTDTGPTDARPPIEVPIENLLNAAQGAPPSSAVLFVVNEMYGGRRFTCEHRRAAN